MSTNYEVPHCVTSSILPSPHPSRWIVTNIISARGTLHCRKTRILAGINSWSVDCSNGWSRVYLTPVFYSDVFTVHSCAQYNEYVTRLQRRNRYRKGLQVPHAFFVNPELWKLLAWKNMHMIRMMRHTCITTSNIRIRVAIHCRRYKQALL
jgi:hypothetical protein